MMMAIACMPFNMMIVCMHLHSLTIYHIVPIATSHAQLSALRDSMLADFSELIDNLYSYM